jgi:hypothetical protein
VLPSKILIKREEESHTHYIGKYGDNLKFIGFPFYGGLSQTRPLAVLHLLDSEGKLTDSKVWEREKMSEAEADLNASIDELSNAIFCDVETHTFSVELNDLTFGFIPRDDGACIEYKPYGLAFFPPWDGYCET